MKQLLSNTVLNRQNMPLIKEIEEQKNKERRFATGFKIFLNVFGWAVYWHSRTPASLGWLPATVVILQILTVFKDGVRAVGGANTRKSSMLINIALGTSTIIFLFAAIYWSIGSKTNFGPQQLSRLDSFYFTLGTFTTAGTGAIAPISPLARTIVSCQYIVDLVYVAGIIAIGVARLTPSGAQPVPSGGQPVPSRAQPRKARGKTRGNRTRR